MKRIIPLIICCVMAAACTENLDMRGMFTSISDSSDDRFDQSMEYNTAAGYSELAVDSDDYHFFAMSDAHIDETTSNLDTFIEEWHSDASAAPFILFCGDQVNATGHYPKFREHVSSVMDSPGDTLFCALGNHDIYFDQWKVFREYWKTSTYWFSVKTPGGLRDLYICLDSANGTLGRRQREWLDELLVSMSSEGFRHIIVFTHTHFFKRDESQGHTSNYNLEETYDLLSLFSRYGVDAVIQGHSHHRDATVFKGVLYLRLDAIEDHYSNAFYTVMHIGDDIRYEYRPVGPQEPDRKN